jgi:hypothetical protein
MFKTRIHVILGIVIMGVAVVACILVAFGKWINVADGICALITALCVAIMGAYLLFFVKASLKEKQ